MQKQSVAAAPTLSFIDWAPEIVELYHAEWWTQLKKHNIQNYKDRDVDDVTPWFILTPNIVKVTFSVSKLFHQPPEVRFLTIEIFDRFMTQHYLQLFSYIWDKAGAGGHSTHRQWNRVISRAKNQVILRVMSCMQLASKHVSNAKTLTPGVIMNFLRHLGYDFTKRSIMSSERRVIETIKYKIPFSHPLSYVEHLIQRLSKSETGIDLNSLYSTSIQVLDVVYIQHHEIYLKLFHMVTGRWERSPRERREFLNVECDSVYLACAVIACAADLSEANSKAVTWILHREADIPLPDIEGFSSIITEIILSHTSIPTMKQTYSHQMCFSP